MIGDGQRERELCRVRPRMKKNRQLVQTGFRDFDRLTSISCLGSANACRAWCSDLAQVLQAFLEPFEEIFNFTTILECINYQVSYLSGFSTLFFLPMPSSTSFRGETQFLAVRFPSSRSTAGWRTRHLRLRLVAYFKYGKKLKIGILSEKEARGGECRFASFAVPWR